jgi:hypothetical protein
MSQDKELNRFYEGTKYKSANDIKQAYNAVSSFLENKSSTLKGIEQGVKDTLQPMLEKIYDKNGLIHYETINKMSLQEKKYASKIIAQASNKRLSELEKADIHQYAYELAKHYNKKVMKRDTNRYYRGINFKDDKEVQAHLDEMITFYNAKTSSVEGYKASIEKRLEAFREKGVEIPKNKQAEKEFFDFLSSENFKNYKNILDSNQIVSTFNEARDIGKTVEEINSEYQKYRDDLITSDVVRENLGVAPWIEPQPEQPKKHKFKPRRK